jgi:oligopeptide/dipeptide ABC transporter ATP-binding protein
MNNPMTSQPPDTPHAAPQSVPAPAAGDDAEPILSVRDLRVSVRTGTVVHTALDQVSFDVLPGRAMGLVGESGSGKSLTLRAVMGLLPESVRVTGGEILFKGENLLADRGERLQSVRGTGISMVFQEPAVALNPVMRVGAQIADSAAQHKKLNKKQARDYAVHLMTLVGIPDPARRVDSYPFELSGGLRQRVMIAASVACEPSLLLCDEPTTALDVTIQAQVLGLFARLRDELNVSLLYVTHDMAVVAQLCDDVTVLYSGQVMEHGPMREVFDRAEHPYTTALLNSTPRIDGPVKRLESIPGTAPSLATRPAGCPFAPRCTRALNECETGTIPVHRAAGGRWFACRNPASRPSPDDQGEPSEETHHV